MSQALPRREPTDPITRTASRAVTDTTDAAQRVRNHADVESVPAVSPWAVAKA